MDVYNLFRPLLFQLDPELSHRLSLKTLKLYHLAGNSFRQHNRPIQDPVSVMGLNFPNRVGLAAGMDKNGDYIDALATLGFGFIEVGTVTPRAQSGNPRPRLFRISAAEAIVNRMGFNNKGVDYLVERIKKTKFNGILGINIGKNYDTPIGNAISDYVIGLNKVYPYASYVTVNISSPNTQSLRRLQHPDEMTKLLDRLKSEQASLHATHERYVPLTVKIAPDLSHEEIGQIAELLVDYEVDGVIATNTTVNRATVHNLPYADEEGGLSGAPLTNKATEVVALLHALLNGKVPIIGVGGIMNSADAREKIAAGSKLVQLYTGLIYRGPRLVYEVIEDLAENPTRA